MLNRLNFITFSQHLYNVESEIEETYYDSGEGSTSGASSEEWEDESDSWETDNGQVEEEAGTGGEDSTSKTETLPEVKTSTPSATAGADTPGIPAPPELPAGTRAENSLLNGHVQINFYTTIYSTGALEVAKLVHS